MKVLILHEEQRKVLDVSGGMHHLFSVALQVVTERFMAGWYREPMPPTGKNKTKESMRKYWSDFLLYGQIWKAVQRADGAIAWAVLMERRTQARTFRGELLREDFELSDCVPVYQLRA